jgi:hypothetical protein
MWDVLRPPSGLSDVDLCPLAGDAGPALAFDAGDNGLLRPGVLMDGAPWLEAKHREEEVVASHEHLPFDADTTFERQRAPLPAREGLDPQFQTLTSR